MTRNCVDFKSLHLVCRFCYIVFVLLCCMFVLFCFVFFLSFFFVNWGVCLLLVEINKRSLHNVSIGNPNQLMFFQVKYVWLIIVFLCTDAILLRILRYFIPTCLFFLLSCPFKWPKYIQLVDDRIMVKYALIVSGLGPPWLLKCFGYKCMSP